MRLLSYNIQYGFGRDNAYDLARVAKVIAEADIAALQEVDRHWSRTGFDDQPRLLAVSPSSHPVSTWTPPRRKIRSGGGSSGR